MKSNDIHNRLYNEAKKYIPGGVNSAFRAAAQVGMETPIYMESGKGAYITDIEGKSYLDMSMAWGPLILGHDHPVLNEAIQKELEKAWITGACGKLEIDYCKKITEIFPGAEMVRLQTSGTEAVGAAIRLARAYTGKDELITIRGGYHGHTDTTLLDITPNDEVVSSSLGIPKVIHNLVHTVHYNDIEQLESLLEKSSSSIAAVLLEPIPANMGLTYPDEGYLKNIRDLCDKYGVLLVFDEVISGVWVALGGAQEKYGVIPDITVLGKAIGGGMPIGAVAGKREIMTLIKPLGDVYAAGTYAGHPLSMAVGLATLEYLQHNPNLQNSARERANRFSKTINIFAEKQNISCRVVAIGQLMSIFFGISENQRSFRDSWKINQKAFNDYYQYMLNNGVYLSPSSEDVMFVSVVHSLDDIKLLERFTLEYLEKKSAKISM